MTDWTPREMELDLSFLPMGDYNIKIMRDGINAAKNAEDYKSETIKLSIPSKLKIKLAPGGGWAAIISQ